MACEITFFFVKGRINGFITLKTKAGPKDSFSMCCLVRLDVADSYSHTPRILPLSIQNRNEGPQKPNNITERP